MQYNPTIAKQLSRRLNVFPHLGLILGTFLSIVLDCLQNGKIQVMKPGGWGGLGMKLGWLGNEAKHVDQQVSIP